MPILVNAGLCIASGLLAAAYLPESTVWVAQQKACAQNHRRIALPKDLDGQQHEGIRSFPLPVWGVFMTEFL